MSAMKRLAMEQAEWEELHGAEPFPEPTATEVLDAQMRLMTYWHERHNATNPPCSFAAFLQSSWVIGDAKRWVAQHGVAATHAWLDEQTARPVPPGDIVERLDARPAGNLIGRRRGNDTQVVRLGE